MVAVAGSALLLASCSAAGDSAYPAKSVQVVVPYSAGGPSDTSTRALTECMASESDASFVVVNKEGGGTAVGTQAVVNAKPDGYTLGQAGNINLTLTPMIEDLGYGVDDVTPIGMYYQTQMIFVTNANSPYDTFEAFLDEAKKAPGELSVSTPGATSPKTIAAEAVAEESGADFNIVPFDGQSRQVAALLGNNNDVMAAEATQDIAELVESGEVRPLAVIGKDPVAWTPETPTLDDLGFAEAVLPNNMYFLAGPKDLPDEVVSTLAGYLETCINDEGVISKIGEEFVPTEFIGPDESEELLDKASSRYEEVLGN